MMKLRTRNEFWIFDGSTVVRIDGRPVILANRKLANQLIVAMGMSGVWTLEERGGEVPEMRGRKPEVSPTMKHAAVQWVLMGPGKQPTKYDLQRVFAEKYIGPIPGTPTQKRRSVSRFIKQVQRLARDWSARKTN